MSGRPRRWWLAALLSVAQPGLGQLYAGRPWRAAVFAVAPMLTTWVAVEQVPAWRHPIMAAAFALTFALSLAAVVDAALLARRPGAAEPARRYDRVVVYAALFLAMMLVRIGVTQVLRHTRAQAFRSPSESMAPTLELGDYFFVDRRPEARAVPVGTPVVIELPRDPRLSVAKRVVAGPGQRVELRDKRLFVDGREVVEPYVRHVDSGVLAAADGPRDNLAPLTVPPGHLFVLGDNRDNSLDSRFFGPVPAASVLGTVRGIYWSMDAAGGRVRWERVGKAVR